jgi:hypothetical protein
MQMLATHNYYVALVSNFNQKILLFTLFFVF